MANVAAALKEAFDFFWVGFYLKKEDQLVLGPFQGPLACTRINFGTGVCGTAYSTKQTVIVPDVDDFASHIACNLASRSEIVVPVFGSKNEVVAVLAKGRAIAMQERPGNRRVNEHRTASTYFSK